MAQAEGNVVAYAYFNIGADDFKSESRQPYLSLAKFQAQINEIEHGGYHPISLPDIFDLTQDKSILLSFDNPDEATYHTAIPQLLAQKIPFAIFISPGQTSEAIWSILKNLKDNSLVTLGLSSHQYLHQGSWPNNKIFADINLAKSIFSEKLGRPAEYFAYPYGEFSQSFKKIVASSGFKAAFGQNSGVIYDGSDFLSLPRFTMTDDFGGIDRFRLTANSLPFAASDIQPFVSYVPSLNSIGFTVGPEISPKDLKKLNCHSSSGEIQTEILSSRVELRFPVPILEKIRVNCTLPVTAEDADTLRHRWLGFLYTLPETEKANDYLNPPQP